MLRSYFLSGNVFLPINQTSMYLHRVIVKLCQISHEAYMWERFTFASMALSVA